MGVIVRESAVEDVPRLVALNEITQKMHADSMPEMFRFDASDDDVAADFEAEIEADSSFWLVAEMEEIAGFLRSEFRKRQET